MANHFGILAWRIPWTEEPGRLQSIGSKESDMTEATQQTSVYIYIYIYIYNSTMRKKEILPFVTSWMDLEGIMLSEVGQRAT